MFFRSAAHEAEHMRLSQKVKPVRLNVFHQMLYPALERGKNSRLVFCLAAEQLSDRFEAVGTVEISFVDSEPTLR